LRNQNDLSIYSHGEETIVKVKTTKITTANLTTVPSAIRGALNLKAGDYIKWCIENEKVVVYKVWKAETKK